MDVITLTLVIRFAATNIGWHDDYCISDLNCSLVGECRAGTCICDAGWGGAECATLQLLPVSFPQGYGMVRSLQGDVNTTWGGNIIAADGRFHMYVNAIANQCLLGSWAENSRIDHVVSDTVEGPYTYQDTAVNITSSNPAPVVLVKDKYKYAMFHIFNGTEVHVEHCYPNGSRIWPYPPHAVDSGTAAMALPPSKAAEVSDGASASRASGIPRTRQLGADWRNHQISVSDSLDGPWELLQPAPGDAFPTCNNPAPWVHPNGTLYCLCGGSLRRADTITGPWQNVSDLVPKGHVWPLPKGWHHEDAFLFTTKRGWHALFHASVPNSTAGAGNNCAASTVSAHMFSVDGFTWHGSSISPYGTQVEVLQPAANGGAGTEIRVMTVATRERPKLVFDANGEITHLINGVCSAPSCTDSPRTGCVDCKYHHWDFTLIQPVQQGSN